LLPHQFVGNLQEGSKNEGEDYSDSLYDTPSSLSAEDGPKSRITTIKVQIQYNNSILYIAPQVSNFMFSGKVSRDLEACFWSIEHFMKHVCLLSKFSFHINFYYFYVSAWLVYSTVLYELIRAIRLSAATFGIYRGGFNKNTTCVTTLLSGYCDSSGLLSLAPYFYNFTTILY
jgi:hypothetical protein